MPTWKRNFYLVWLNNFITAVGMMAFIPLFPLVLRDLGITDPAQVSLWSGVLVAGAPLTAAFMGPFWGSLGDRFGRKIMLLRANLAITIFVGAMGLATSPLQLLLLRFGQGIFSGFVAPSLTLVSVGAPADRQGRVTGMLHTAMIAGGIVGPLLGGAIGDRIGLRIVFLVPAALSVVAAIITGLFVVEPDRPQRAGMGPGVPFSSVLRDTVRDIVSFAGAGPLRSLLLVVFAVRFGAALIDPILALYVETLTGFDPEHLATASGFVFALTMVATLVMTPFWGRLGDRIHPTRTLAWCAFGAALTYLPQAAVGDVRVLAGLRFLSGACIAGIFPAAYAITAKAFPVEKRGSGFGFTFSSLILANALGPIAGGALAATVGLRACIVVAGLLMLGAAFRALRLSRLQDLRDGKGPGDTAPLTPQPGAAP